MMNSNATNKPNILPKSWVSTSLGFCLKEMYRYPTFYGMEHLTEGVPVIRGEHINADGTISHVWQDYWFVAEDVSENYPRTVVEFGDLIMSVRGSIGKMGFIDERLVGSQVSPNCLRISTFKDFLVPKFLMYFLKSAQGQELIQSLTSATTIKTIKASLITQIPIPLPPFSEQHHIVSKIEELFTKLNAGVDALRKVKAQLKRYRQSVLRYAFEGKLTEEWRKSKGDNLEDISVLLEKIGKEREKNIKRKRKKQPSVDMPNVPKLPLGWAWTTLGFCSKEISRYPTFYGMEHLTEGVPVIRGEHINEDGKISHDWEHYWYVSNEISEDFPRTITEYGDLIMSVRGTIGKIGLIDEKLSGAQVSPNCLRISLFKDFYASKLLLYYLKSILGQEIIQGFTSATTVKTIKSSLITEIPIPLIPLQEQYKIVEKIDAYFSTIDYLEKIVLHSLRQSEGMHQSILKKAFSGKLVPQDPSDEPAEKLLNKIKSEKEKLATEKKTTKRKRKAKTKQMRLI